MRKYDAIIFDLYGTLVDDLAYPESQGEIYWREMSKASDILGTPADEFRRVWMESGDIRATGELPTLEASLLYICGSLGVSPREEQIDEAVRVRLAYMNEALVSRPNNVEVITKLRESGHKIGLLSDCSSDTAVIVPRLPFAPLMDTLILSCEVGMKKPDPRIFQLACERLDVSPERCLYIGDGGSDELTGATNVGMTAVMIRAPYDTVNGRRQDWDGARISSIGEILNILH